MVSALRLLHGGLFVLLVIAASINIAAMCSATWSIADGYYEPVGDSVHFLRVRVGPTHTCVTLRRNNTATSPLHTAESCYVHSHDENNHPTSVRDAKTNQWVTLPELCKNDRVSIAESLGIPEKTGILELWDRRCSAKHTLFMVFEVLGFIVFSIALVIYYFIARNRDEGDGMEVGALACGFVSTISPAVCAAVWWVGINTGEFRIGSSTALCLVSAILSGVIAVGCILQSIIGRCRAAAANSSEVERGFEEWKAPA